MRQELEHWDSKILSGGPTSATPIPYSCKILVLGFRDMWFWGGGSLRHKQRKTIWSSRDCQGAAVPGAGAEAGNTGEASLGPSLGPSPSPVS